METFAHLLAAPGAEEFLGQFLEPIAIYDRTGQCLFQSKQFVETLQETDTAAEDFAAIGEPGSRLYPYWVESIDRGVSEFIEPQLFCKLSTAPGSETIVLRIQQCPLRLIVESINYAAVVVDEQRTLVCYNQQFLQLLEIESPFPCELDLNQLVLPEDRNQDQDSWNDLIEGRISEYHIEKRFVKRGELIWTDVHIKAVPPERIPGTEFFYTVILEDISDARATFEALEVDHHKWQLFLENRLNLFFQTDLDGRLLLVSNAVKATLGHPPQTLSRMSIFDLVHPRDRANFRQFLKLCSETETIPIMLEYCFKKYRSEEEVYLYIHGQKLSAGRFQSASIIFYAVDISERKQLERELQENEERYRSLVSNLPGAVYRSSDDFSSHYYGFQVISPAIEEVTGYALGEFVRNPSLYRSLILEGDRAMLKQSIDHAMSAGEAFTLEYQIRDASGNLRWIQDRARCVTDDGGRMQWIDGVLFDVTQQKQSEELLRAIFEQAAVGINLMDLDGRIIDANQKQCEMLGYSKSELIGRSAIELTLPEEQTLKQQYLDDLFAGRINSYSTDKIDVGKNGQQQWVTITISAIRERGQPKYLVTIVQDISERKQAEASRAAVQSALESSEARLRLLFERASIGISITDERGYIVRCNAALQSFLGYSEAELQQIRFDRYTHPDDLEADSRMFKALVAGEIPQYQIEKRYLRSDSTLVWGNLRIATQIDSEGQQLMFAFVEDITERKRQEEQLRQQEVQFRAIFETAPLGIAALNPEGCYLRTNSAYERMMGYSFEEIIRTTFQELTYLDDLDYDLAHYDQIIRGEQNSYQIEKRYVRPDGSTFWAQLTVAAVRQPDGQLQFTYGLIQDITEIKQTQASSERLLRLLETTIELSTDGILILDLAWKLQYCNQQFLNLWEIAKEAVANQDDRQLIQIMKTRVVNPDEFVAQVEREYAIPTLEDSREWQLTSSKTYLRVSRPQIIDGQVVGRVVVYREIGGSFISSEAKIE